MDEINLNDEKKKVLSMYMLFPVVLILIIIVITMFVANNSSDKNKIIKFVKNNSTQLEKYVNGEIDKLELNNEITFKNDLDYNRDCNNKTCFVKFEVDSYGFSSNSCYIGFYYSEKDIVHKFEYSERKIVRKNFNSYSIKEENGDNEISINKIKNHWYYYEDCY